jgi:hypothetical protein
MGCGLLSCGNGLWPAKVFLESGWQWVVARPVKSRPDWPVARQNVRSGPRADRAGPLYIYTQDRHFR